MFALPDKYRLKRQMEFNLGKCEVLRFGTTNKGRAYNGGVVGQGDLELQVHNSLKFVSHVGRVVTKVLGTLAFIAQSSEYRSWEAMLRLYRTV
eukprot:g38482.t1